GNYIGGKKFFFNFFFPETSIDRLKAGPLQCCLTMHVVAVYFLSAHYLPKHGNTVVLNFVPMCDHKESTYFQPLPQLYYSFLFYDTLHSLYPSLVVLDSTTSAYFASTLIFP